MNDQALRSRADVIRDIYALAENMGFRRLRVDRAGYGGTDQNPDCYIEVGYASEEIRIRTSVPGLFYRKQWDLVEMDGVIELLDVLLDRNPEEGPQ